MTLYDTTNGWFQVKRLSDGCRTLSDCRTVGLSDCRALSDCRTRVGILSDITVGLSYRGSALRVLEASFIVFSQLSFSLSQLSF